MTSPRLPALAAFRAWFAAPRLTAGGLAVFALLLFLRKPHALHTPQLWAEDGSIFLSQHDAIGPAALAEPYAGYLHTLPRLVAWFAAALFDPAYWPAVYNGATFLVWLAVIARLFSPRFALPGKPWLALALLAVPHSGEVFGHVTNLQWLTAFVLVQQLLLAPAATRGQAVSDLSILLLVGLTGPFALAFLPLFFARWLLAVAARPLAATGTAPAAGWSARLFSPDARAAGLAFLAVALAAAVQAWFFTRTGPAVDRATPFQVLPALEILARRLVVWPVFGRDLAFAFPPAVVSGLGLGLLAALSAWSLRPHPRRTARAFVLGAAVLLTVAAVLRARPDTWGGADNYDFSDRYFYIPRALLAWLLIWEFDTPRRTVAWTARALCLAALLAHARHYPLPAPPDYAWASHVEPIRRGVPAIIPILPEGWDLEYPGRPAR